MSVTNGLARYPVLIHAYYVGFLEGYRVVGIERPETTEIDARD